MLTPILYDFSHEIGFELKLFFVIKTFMKTKRNVGKKQESI
jgi:hypothetical protein